MSLTSKRLQSGGVKNIIVEDPPDTTLTADSFAVEGSAGYISQATSNVFSIDLFTKTVVDLELSNGQVDGIFRSIVVVLVSKFDPPDDSEFFLQHITSLT